MESVYQHSRNKIIEKSVEISRGFGKLIVRCSRPPHYLKIGQFTSCSEREMNRNVGKCHTYVQVVHRFCKGGRGEFVH